MTPDEWESIRSIARCVLPVFVGPRTAVTPRPAFGRFEYSAFVMRPRRRSDSKPLRERRLAVTSTLRHPSRSLDRRSFAFAELPER